MKVSETKCTEPGCDNLCDPRWFKLYQTCDGHGEVREETLSKALAQVEKLKEENARLTEMTRLPSSWLAGGPAPPEVK